MTGAPVSPRFVPTPLCYIRGVGYDITDADAPFLSMIGYTREDLDHGRISWRDMTPPEFLHLDEAGMRQAAESGGFTAPYQKEFFRKDGTRVKVLLVCAFVPGRAAEWVGYVVDLSAERGGRASEEDYAQPLTEPLPVEMTARLVNELVRERARMVAMLDNTPALIWAVDERMRLLGFNQAFQDAQRVVSGKVVEIGDELVGELYPPEVTRPWKAWYARALAGEPFSDVLDTVLLGRPRFIEYQFSPIVGAGGAILGVTVVSADLTARILTERRLEASDARFRSLASSLPVGIYLADAAGALTYVNPRFCQIFGRDAEALLGHGYLEQLPAAAREALASTWCETAGMGPREVSLAIRGSEGAPRTLRWKAERSEHAETQAAFVGSIEDETERLAVAEQMRQRDKMESLGTLAGGIAHDFNNLLAVILGFAELAEGAGVAEAQKDEALRAIRTAGLRARDLVQRILAFSRRTERTMTPHDLVALVEESTKLLRAAIPSNVELVVDLPPSSVHVNCEPSALQQVLLNLAVNAEHALRATPRPRISVRVEPKRIGGQATAAPSGTVSLVVSDNGMGIPPDVAARVFDPFFTTKPPGEGTGMGLAAAHGIVLSHDGEISVSSTPGGGATFTVTLPIAAAAAAQPSRVGASALSLRGRVLVVEDEEGVAMVVRRALERSGVEVTSCPSGDEALARLATEPVFDLLITDLAMPGMRGDELARVCAERWPALPCVVMSGFGEEIALDERLATGAPRAFLQKPFTMAELVAAARRFLPPARHA